MERRKFFKSLGLFGLAAVLPKFLFGEDKSKSIKIKSGFSKECAPQSDLIVNNDKVVEWSDTRTAVLSNGNRQRYVLCVDRALWPSKMEYFYWYNSLKNDKVLLYSSRNIKVRPVEIYNNLKTNSCPFFKILDLYNNEFAEQNSYLFDLIKDISIKDVETGWEVNKDGFANYMSIQRYPRTITGGESI